MDSKRLESINLVFENCEDMSFVKNEIGAFCIKDIEQIIARVATNSIRSFFVANEIAIELYPEGNTEYAPFGITDDSVCSKFERIQKWADIAGLYIKYEDGSEDEYSVAYNEEDYSIGAANINQDTFLSSLGHLYITISNNGKKVGDYFNIDHIEDIYTAEDECNE